jgi:eukaryotic-like serine/threonine-protein kinase
MAKENISLRELFDEIVDLPLAERQAKAATLTSDTALQRDALELALASDVSTSRATNISAPMLSIVEGLAGPELSVGDTLGAWQLTRELGHGGMGAVYLAERRDGQFEQRAAIKLLQGFASAEALVLLARERQIMANLSHPNIARLLDGGATPKGRPYLVMEYIAGVPLDDYIAKHALPLKKRLQLLIEICRAVSFAHSRLVVHCDLKPSNIMVDDNGHPMLLDFGIAALIGADISGENETRQAFTPRYASPELKAGLPISTATDVYSLGVILGEMLGELVNPNDDLMAIIKMATMAEANLRYSSVALLAKDIEHYLTGMPVKARAATPTYVLTKLVRRRWPVFVALTALALGASAFTHGLMRERDRALEAETRAANELVRAQAAEEVAQTERERASVREQEAIASRATALGERDRAVRAEIQTQIQSVRTRDTRDFLFSLFDSADPNKGGTPNMSAADLLARGKQRVNNLPAAQDEFKTEMLMVLARIYDNIGLLDEAKTLYRDAGLRLKQDSKEALLNRYDKYADTLNRIALIESNNQNPAAAEAPAREALAIRKQYPHPDATQQALMIANAQNTLGLVLDKLGREEAGNMLRASLATREKLSKAPSAEVAASLHNLGIHQRRLGNFKDAEKNLLKALDIHYKLHGKHHPKTLSSVQVLAQILVDQRRFSEAEPLLADNYQAMRQVHGDNSEYVSGAANEWGSVLYNMGRYDEAILRYRDSVDISARAADPKQTLPVSYAISVNNLAGLYEEIGDLPRAEENYRISMKVRRANLAPDDLSVARIEHNLGRLLLKVGKNGEAETLLQQAYQTRLKKRGLAHGETHETILALAERAQLDGDTTLAAKLIGSLDEKIIAQRPSRSLQKMRIEALLAPAASALPIWQARQALAEKNIGATHLATMRTKLDTAEALQQLGRTIEARQLALDVQPRFNAVLAAGAPDRRRLAALLATP